MYLKLLRPIHALKFSKTLQWHFGRAGNELQKLGLVLFIKSFERAPKPLNLQRVGRVLVVFSIASQILKVYLRQTRYQELKLLFVENRDQTLRYDLIKALQKRRYLLSDRADHFLLTHQSNVLVLVLVGYFKISPVRLEISRLRHAELVYVDSKIEINAQRVDIRLQNRDQVLVKLVIDRFHVGVLDWHA